mmetsp:Transcript_1614/g.5700  ORF Transcript_1614/g.5700 Transcript_1614/m.5700 type:complete len:218 (-) Transcript_1614:288-941(-)
MAAGAHEDAAVLHAENLRALQWHRLHCRRGAAEDCPHFDEAREDANTVGECKLDAQRRLAPCQAPLLRRLAVQAQEHSNVALDGEEDLVRQAGGDGQGVAAAAGTKELLHGAGGDVDEVVLGADAHADALFAPDHSADGVGNIDLLLVHEVAAFQCVDHDLLLDSRAQPQRVTHLLHCVQVASLRLGHRAEKRERRQVVHVDEAVREAEQDGSTANN